MSTKINQGNLDPNTPTYWKWIIAFSCSWINVFTFGIFRSIGLLFGAFVSEYDCTYRQASWPVSLIGSFASITGLLAAFLSHYFQIRTLVFTGVLICSFATSICYLATDIIQITIFLGVIQGIGVGLVTNLLPAIIAQYFGKQRAIACGISYAGSTAGAFIFPLFIEWQLNTFELSGTLLLMGGITLHGLIGALLLRPIETSDQKSAVNGVNKRVVGVMNSPALNRQPLIDECETVVFLRKNREESDHQYVNINSLRERPKSIADFGAVSAVPPVVKMRDTLTRHHVDRNRVNRMSLPVFHERRFVRDLNHSLATAHQSAHSLAAGNTLPKTASPPKIKYSLMDSMRRHVREDLKLFLNIHFQLCSQTYLVFIIDFVIFLIILPDFAIDRGLTAHEGTVLLSLYSITDLFGRLIPGWISYLDYVSNRNIFVSSIGVMGLTLLAMPFANSFPTFAALTLVCGFVTGCQMVLPPVVLSEYLGADNTAVAFGLSNFMCGSLTIIFRPLLIGVKDRTGHYDILFYILGCLGIASALLWLVVICNNSTPNKHKINHAKLIDRQLV